MSRKSSYEYPLGGTLEPYNIVRDQEMEDELIEKEIKSNPPKGKKKKDKLKGRDKLIKIKIP